MFPGLFMGGTNQDDVITRPRTRLPIVNDPRRKIIGYLIGDRMRPQILLSPVRGDLDNITVFPSCRLKP